MPGVARGTRPWIPPALTLTPLCPAAGDQAAVDAQRELHLRIAEATDCLKNGVLVENDEGAVAAYLAQHPELAARIGSAAGGG